jgi:hypothetical protein
MKTQTKRCNVFTPENRKTDSVRCAYLGQDGSIVVLFERRTRLGTQRYARIAIKAVSISLRSTHNSTSLQTELARVVIHDTGILSFPLAAGKPVHVDIYPNNGSEGTRAKGYTVQSLYISAGREAMCVSTIDGLYSGGFTIQTQRESIGLIPAMNAETLRQYRDRWDGDTTVISFDDAE